MKTAKCITCFWVFLAAILTMPASAALSSAGDPRFGQDSVTVDTNTGLVWLDLPHSRDLSYADALAATQPGGSLVGFRHATVEEILSLYISAGFAPGFIPESNPTHQYVTWLISLLGATSDNGVIGISGSATLPDSVAVCYLTSGTQDGVSGYFVTATPPTLNYAFGTHYPTVGNWLVMVPEPSSLCLLFLGLGGLLYKQFHAPQRR
jgi:hypothetical protein